jgi:hypothetical protein
MMPFLFLLGTFPLNGTWAQPCLNGYFRTEIFLGNSATYVERNFWDSACTEPSVVTTSRGEIDLGDAVSAPAGALALDFTFASVTLKPVTEAVASAWRERTVCGIADWHFNEEREVTGRNCDFSGQGTLTRVPGIGDRRFGVVKLGSNQISFGRLSPGRDGSEPDRRPVVLDPVPYFSEP